MTKLKKPISFETAFGMYVIDELLGEGGAGRVYGGVGIDEAPIALKVLAQDRATADKSRRFKNETAFLARNKHRNIVTVIDYGIASSGELVGPFYVMRRYNSTYVTSFRVKSCLPRCSLSLAKFWTASRQPTFKAWRIAT